MTFLIGKFHVKCKDGMIPGLSGSLSGDDLVTKSAGRLRIKARAVDFIDLEELQTNFDNTKGKHLMKPSWHLK